jgi:hypothetical protein
MSRYCDLYVLIRNVPANLESQVTDLLEDFVEDILNVDIAVNNVDKTLEYEITNNATLCGGYGTEDAHDRLKGELAKLEGSAGIVLVTKWYCCGDWSWGESYGEDEPAEAA